MQKHMQFNSILGGNLISTQQSESGGSLLTPEEGCGLTRVKNKRIVGGSVAPVGAWPWMALLVYLQEDGLAFDCGNSYIHKFSLFTCVCRHVAVFDTHFVQWFFCVRAQSVVAIKVRKNNHSKTCTHLSMNF